MADKQEEIGKIAESLPNSQANAAAVEPKSGEPKLAEQKSDQNSSNSQQNAALQKEAVKEPEKEITPAAAKSEPKMSKGEKVFNWVTYQGLNYWTNLLLSVAAADRFINPPDVKRTGKINEFIDGFINRQKLDEWVSKTTKAVANVTKKAGLNIDLWKIHKKSNRGWESLMLLTGGTLLLLPLKFLEDNKRKIVHATNKKLGVSQVAPDGHEETPEEIHIEKEQPKQSVGNLIWRRAIGTVTVVSTGIAIDKIFESKKQKLDAKTVNLGWEEVHYPVRPKGGQANVEDTVFGWINKVAKKMRGKEFNKNGIVSRWTRLAILDTFFTAITASVMYVTSGAKKGKMPKEIDDSNDPAVLKDEVNRITTAAEISDKAFTERVEQRVKTLVDARSNGVKKGFVETLQNQDLTPTGVGV